MKGIYKVFKSEIQKAIKKIAETRGMFPMNVLTTTGEVFSEYQTSLEEIAERLASDFDIDPKNIFQMEEDFRSEVQDFICPEWNPTCGDSLTSHLNKQLAEEGYSTIGPDALDFLFAEIQAIRQVD